VLLVGTNKTSFRKSDSVSSGRTVPSMATAFPRAVSNDGG
jgi:hypothetical protein